MGKEVFINGNEAICRGTLNAGCLHFFGYPITPQNEIPEFFSRELPPRGGRFLQAESESAVGAMLFGAAAAGVKVLTSTSSPGWALMQEMLSHIGYCELPCVVVDVQRGGPGQGTVRHAQTDYLSATRGGCGGYKSIVLAPASPQDCHDLVQLAFYLADKYRILTVVLSDGILGQLTESVELKVIDFGHLPEKNWALKGTSRKGGNFNHIHSTRGIIPPIYKLVMQELYEKYQKIIDTEVRFETYHVEDARLTLVAYGYAARICREAVNMARSTGLKVGLIQPVTLWPFPYQIIRQKAAQGSKFLVVEDSMGQLIEDVRLGVEGKGEVNFWGMSGRHSVGELGMLFPEGVFEEVKRYYE
ncbi:MAG: 3-methyl-2-oxobutanoate dehydrogenase subunit VorB [Chloroflexota bacterium]|nr:3-methyl-2-oxobutanoate dehydrogenase subunit VorB [Chloroflexota bacterium]